MTDRTDHWSFDLWCLNTDCLRPTLENDSKLEIIKVDDDTDRRYEIRTLMRCPNCKVTYVFHMKTIQGFHLDNSGRDYVHSQVYTKTRPIKVRKHWWQFWRPRGPGFIAVGK